MLSGYLETRVRYGLMDESIQTYHIIIDHSNQYLQVSSTLGSCRTSSVRISDLEVGVCFPVLYVVCIRVQSE